MRHSFRQIPTMAPGNKRKSAYQTDEFVVSDDEERPSKRGKGGKSTFHASNKPHVDDNGDQYFEIAKARRVTVSEFKKNVLINIREYYESGGKWLPGKKVRLDPGIWIDPNTDGLYRASASRWTSTRR